MHVIFNAGERADDRDGHTVFIFKGSSKGKRTLIEKKRLEQKGGR